MWQSHCLLLHCLASQCIAMGISWTLLFSLDSSLSLSDPTWNRAHLHLYLDYMGRRRCDGVLKQTEAQVLPICSNRGSWLCFFRKWILDFCSCSPHAVVLIWLWRPYQLKIPCHGVKNWIWSVNVNDRETRTETCSVAMSCSQTNINQHHWLVAWFPINVQLVYICMV